MTGESSNRKPISPRMAVAAGVLGVAGCAHTASTGGGPTYPETVRGDHVDDYHGTLVADPYRWLEDGDSEATSNWIDNQNEVTDAYLSEVACRDDLRERLETLSDYEKFGIPFKEGGRTFYRQNDGLSNQAVLFVLDTPNAEPRVLLDPNSLADDGTVALKDTVVSPDGKLLAYGLSASGSDWEEWRVRDVETAEDLPDRLEWVKFSSASWARDSSGFYYSGYDEPVGGGELANANYGQKLSFHRIGDQQADDELVYERPDEKDWLFGGTVTDDDRYLVVTVFRGTERRNLCFYLDRSVADGATDAPMVELIGAFEAQYVFVGNEGPLFLFRSTFDAPLGRVIGIDVQAPAPENWQEVVPESEDTLVQASHVGGRIIASYLHHAHSRVRVFDRCGAPVWDVDLPGIGTVEGLHGHADDPETYFAFTSFTAPPSVFRYDVATGDLQLYRAPEVDLDPADFEVRQVFVESKDGTRVPLFIGHRKGLELDGGNPTLLYGYGGFNVPLTPGFSVANLVWMELGGVYVMANLRGGGEYGREWHLAGTKERKQNVFDDFISAAEWLIAEGYTSSPKLAIAGGSNGGLLIGACMTQRPELFGACIAAVGVLDMLRYQYFTIGWAWISDYGSSEDAEEFKSLHAYSPLHNLREGTHYPATLIMTGDHDDRVVPAHSFKFIAELQRCQGGPAPTLIRVDRKAGHGAGKPTEKVIDEAADRLAFLVRALGGDTDLDL